MATPLVPTSPIRADAEDSNPRNRELRWPGSPPDQARPGSDPSLYFLEVRNYEDYRYWAAFNSRQGDGRLLAGLQEEHERMIRGLDVRYGRSLVEPDYRESLEAAMWHCCRIQGLAGPTPWEMEDPTQVSIFQAHVVGLCACNNNHFLAAYSSPSQRPPPKGEPRDVSSRSSQKSSSTRSSQHKYALIPASELALMQEQLEKLSMIRSSRASSKEEPPRPFASESCPLRASPAHLLFLPP